MKKYRLEVEFENGMFDFMTANGNNKEEAKTNYIEANKKRLESPYFPNESKAISVYVSEKM